MTQALPTAPLVPVIPDHSPFSKEQIAWLNGYFAGLFSWKSMGSVSGVAPAIPQEKITLTVAFGSQTGTSESLAKSAVKLLSAAHVNAKAKDLSAYTADDLKKEKHLLIITSTYGEGEPPDNVKGFHELLSQKDSLGLTDLKFAVLGLGDTNYAKFCQCGKDLDAFLERHGAKRMAERVDCDTDYEDAYKKWTADIKALLANAKAASETTGESSKSSALIETPPSEASEPIAFTKKNP
ncbi:MAG: flavodoxin domain-containing protein, partial [Spirochaetia bacterium]|nr:flavodoxin domain-containing protein [Spirochaetia bacterium]